MPPNSQPLPFIHLDDWIVAIDKPSGMFVHRSAADRSATEIVLQQVRDQLGEFVFPVHRLDRATSGVLLMARSSESAAAMARLFAEQRVAKTYLTLVRGHMPASGTIDDPMTPSRGRGLVNEHTHALPQTAETRYQCLEQFEVPLCSDRYPTTRCSLIEAKPKTGRFHQIRRHMNYVSHPVIGDTSHGDGRQNRFFREHFGANRLMLAAVKLEFVHPFTKSLVTIDCPPAQDFQKVIERIPVVASDKESES